MAAAEPQTRTYLDYNATAPIRPEARAAVVAAMETIGNPSSVHAEGRAARRIVEEARAEVARLAGVSARCVTFTSGATEAVNVVLNPRFGVRPNEPPLDRLIVSAGRAPLRPSGPPVSRCRGRSRAAQRRRPDRSRLARRSLPAAGPAAARAAGGEQRDRRDPAGRRGGGARPRRRRLCLLRRRPAGRAVGLQPGGARRRCAGALGPQDRRARRAPARSSSPTPTSVSATR